METNTKIVLDMYFTIYIYVLWKEKWINYLFPAEFLVINAVPNKKPTLWNKIKLKTFCSQIDFAQHTYTHTQWTIFQFNCLIICYLDLIFWCKCFKTMISICNNVTRLAEFNNNNNFCNQHSLFQHDKPLISTNILTFINKSWTFIMVNNKLITNYPQRRSQTKKANFCIKVLFIIKRTRM